MTHSTATLTAGPLDGRTVHYARPGRIGASVVTLCNGRTLAYSLTGGEVTCRLCKAAVTGGRIILDPALAAPAAR